jgi:lincosamide nucleotidyltransferase A/C/D/E
MSEIEPEFSAEDVIEFLSILHQNNIEVILDGGWGVDALLGMQTRKHSDLDIALEHVDASRLRSLLEARGYKDVLRNDTRDCNFVLGDDDGHLVDFHTYTFNANHEHIFGVPYPYESLTGMGKILDHPVRCISPEWMVKFHTGYTLDENDYRDVRALCERFKIEMPRDYDEFERRAEEKNC